MNELRDRLALVTGASAGIGAATARALSAAGAEVILAARRAAELERVAADCPRARTLVLDVCDAAAVERALADLPLDVVLANAGLAFGVEPLQEGDAAEWSTVIDTNVKGVLHTLRAVLPGMIERGRGDVVTLGSVAGRQVYAGGAVYCATKFAVKALYETMRLELCGKNLRLITVDPAMVETDFSRVRFRGDEARADAVYDGMTPLGPGDVADAVLYAVTRPPHVNVGEIVLWPTDQASTSLVHRSP
ncbi:MAG: SDR family NAD(P)-dependent oxidoreductase [Planctomycetota bacterium]|jgi:NADP-dependent 3-hydroxy acid dehydrogenase YdfG|nr:SDR family NAD(P)-dependent oxidoreductase [Planctomycetota bacterium]MDP6762930.1 SDR family NAD(P)-dependent oxidoreductase [Planctomycetota bacterium]MDP6988608.1 SDR family NAD(P)-dependent oxidoreductase [Planctomycetota bacterium]